MIWINTFNGHAINDKTNYEAYGRTFQSMASAKPAFLEHEHADPVDSGAWTVDVSTIIVTIKIANYANRRTLQDQLKNWFKRGIQGDLVVTFTDESKTYQKTCRVVNIAQDPDFPLRWNATLLTGQTAWRAVTATTYNWNLSTTGGNRTETLPATDDETRLSVEFEASGLPTVGYLYQRLYRLVPPAGVTYGTRPWRIDLDTAAIIADTSKSNQINQVGGITNSTLTIPIDTAVGGGLPTGGGYCYVDTEQIQYSSISGGNITVVTGGRGVNGTTAATHADNAVIKWSRMQADCNDLRVIAGDVEVRRTIVDPNTATTKIWVHGIDLKTGFRLTLGAAIGPSADITVLQTKVDATHQQMIAVLPEEGILYHGTEWIAYRGRNATTCQLSNPVRGLFSTTKQSHAVGDSFDFIPTAVRIVYGNSGVGDPASDDIYYDETKPLFDLSNSTNSQWVYSASTLFYDPLEPNRPGAWIPEVTRLGDVTTSYRIKQNAASGDPALGSLIGAYLNGNVWTIENATVAWKFYSPGGIQEVSATGQTYRSTASFPATAALQYLGKIVQTTVTKVKKKARAVSVLVEAWISLWNESSPASVTTWTGWTHNTVSVPNTATWVRFALSGTMTALIDAIAAFEALTVTVVFTSANVPSGSLLSESSNYPLALSLTNTTNGDVLSVDFSMKTNVPFTIDGEEFTVLYQGLNVHNAITLDNEARDVFIRLGAGANALVVTSADVGSLLARLSYYRRRL